MAQGGAVLIPFQGQLADGTGAQVPDGVYEIHFTIYDALTDGVAVWTEAHETVSVMGGRVNVLLGALNPTISAIDFALPKFLALTVLDISNQEMAPRHQLVPAFHARSSDTAGVAALAQSVADSSIDSLAIEDSAITSADIADGTIGSADIGELDGNKLVDGSVGVSKTATRAFATDGSDPGIGGVSRRYINAALGTTFPAPVPDTEAVLTLAGGQFTVVLTGQCTGSGTVWITISPSASFAVGGSFSFGFADPPGVATPVPLSSCGTTLIGSAPAGTYTFSLSARTYAFAPSGTVAGDLIVWEH